jgi:hypothetical protein
LAKLAPVEETVPEFKLRFFAGISTTRPDPIIRSCGVENDLGAVERARGVTTSHDPELRMIDIMPSAA